MTATGRQTLQNEVTTLFKQEKLHYDYTINTKHCGKYRSIKFCVDKVFDGEIRIYGPKFFYLEWQGENRPLPFNGQEKFSSIESLKEFIKSYF